MYIYICDCIYTYKYNIVLSTRLLKSTERISHQPLWCTDLCHFWHFLAALNRIVYRLVNKHGKKKKVLGIGMIFSTTTVQEKRPWDHQVSDVSFCKLPFPLLLAPWSHIRCCMVSSSHLTA